MLSFVAGLSGLYDLIVGAFLLLAADSLASLFGVPPANPRIFSDLNGLFLIAVGAGYYLPWRDPVRYRGYLWIMGPHAQGRRRRSRSCWTTLFRGSPASFLLFAASDGALALLTLWALLREPRPDLGARPAKAGHDDPTLRLITDRKPDTTPIAYALRRLKKK